MLDVPDFGNHDFPNNRLAIGNKRPLIAGQRHQEGQFHPLHPAFNAAQGVAANQDLVRGEDQSETLLLPFVLEFSEGELIERQKQALFSRHFDFDRASVRIARPTFG